MGFSNCSVYVVVTIVPLLFPTVSSWLNATADPDIAIEV
jgi:hypothetical protein